jgi:hypothetical protein
MMRHTILVLALAACGDDGGGSTNPEELITTVELAFAPMGGGTTINAAFRDVDGDGGNPPVIDPVNLTAGTYTLTVKFKNELEAPPEDITVEVMDESDVHQVLLFGTAVNGSATNNPGAPLLHTYGDADANGFPIGLTSSIVATAGSGTLSVMLRHMPPVNDTPVKTGTIADIVKSGGTLPGEADANVNFTATVQ